MLPSILDLIDICEDCYDRPQFVAGPEGRDGASVFSNPGQPTILVFRGTVTLDDSPAITSFLDWLNDAHAALDIRDWCQGRIHEGFAESLDNLWGLLPDFDGDQSYKQDGLIITGHSKGGALAMLAGVKLAHLNPEIITFAAPKVGDDTFAAYAASRVKNTRYQNAHDIVPKLPLVEYLHFGYQVTSPSWVKFCGIRGCHGLETGYRPWIQEIKGEAA